MIRTDAVIDAFAGPVLAGFAIVLLLSARRAEAWKPRKGYRQIPHHVQPAAIAQQGPTRPASRVRFSRFEG
ncbi:hypothetical protein D3C80_1756380 [compost metagenome]